MYCLFSIWEMFMRVQPWTGISAEEVSFRVCAGDRPIFEGVNEGDPDEVLFRTLATKAWAPFPRARPSFADLLAMVVAAHPTVIVD